MQAAFLIHPFFCSFKIHDLHLKANEPYGVGRALMVAERLRRNCLSKEIKQCHLFLYAFLEKFLKGVEKLHQAAR